MQLLASIFSDSFIIWAKNFSLVYVVLLGFLLVSLIMPRELGGGTEFQLLLLAGSLLLVLSAFTAGWLNMIAAACRRYFAPSMLCKPSPVEDLKASLSLFRFFLSGVSLHFVSVTVNYIVAGLVFFLLSLSLQPFLGKILPILQAHLNSTPAEQAQALLNLPISQQHLMQQFSLALVRVLLSFAGFSLLIALWPAYVTQYGDSIFKAYWHSLQRFLKDPIRFLFITGLFIGAQLLSPVISAAFSGNILVGAAVQLGGLLLSIYLMITLFVYTLKTSERPLCIEESDDKEADEAQEDDASGDDSDQNGPPAF